MVTILVLMIDTHLQFIKTLAAVVTGPIFLIIFTVCLLFRDSTGT